MKIKLPPMLVRDGYVPKDGDPQPRGPIRCACDGCPTSYILRSNESENIEPMRKMGAQTIQAGHPLHEAQVFTWSGAKDGWR
jgi:hypothetical protein